MSEKKESRSDDEEPYPAKELKYLPIAAAIVDLSAVRAAMESLEAGGVQSLESHLAATPEEAQRLFDLMRIVWYNEEAQRTFGLIPLPVSGSLVRLRIGLEGLPAFTHIIVRLYGGFACVDSSTILVSSSGRHLPLRVRAAFSGAGQSDWSSVLFFFEMVTNKKGNAVARFDEWAGNKQLFHNMTLGFALHEMIADPEGRPLDYRFMIVNKAYERLTGLRRADVVGRRASEIKVGFDPAWVETFGEVVATGRPVCFQSYSATLNKYFEIRAYRPAAGLFAMMLQDITDRLNDEHALAERERLLRVVLATTGEGFFIADSRGRIGSVNRSYCDMMGYTEEELLGMTLQEQSDGVRPEQIKGRLDRIRRSGHDTFETRHRRKDGSVIDVEVTSSYLDEGEGQFVAFVRDITERKKAERLYREQGERLELALRGTGAGLWDWNVQTGEIILDRNWERILGYPDDEVREATMDRWGELCHPEDLRRSAVVFAKHMAGDLPRYECEIRIRHRDGHWVWALNQGELVERDGAGRPLRMIGLMFDIGAQKGIEEKLRVALSEKESLLSELYHRTKNSMQLINAMLELKKQELNDAEAETAFEDIENKILAMALVQEKLYQSDRLDSIDLGSYMTDLVELLKNEMPATATAIAFAAQGSSIKVSADIAIPCGLIMSELIGNSIGHAFPERESGRIAVSVCEEDDGGISIEEWDDGVGLPSGFNPRMAGRVGLRTVIGIGEEQLHGKISFGNKGGGFSCKITFKDLYYPKRV